MNDDLYSHFQTWQIACNLILKSEPCNLPKPWKVNSVFCWSGDFGIQQLKLWQKDASELTLEFLWKEFEAYCKPQSNELCAHYDLLKKLKKESYHVMTGTQNCKLSYICATTLQRPKRFFFMISTYLG